MQRLTGSQRNHQLGDILSGRESFWSLQLPYIPMPLREVESYGNSADFAGERIKTIETLGILKPCDQRTAFLISSQEDSDCQLELDISFLKVQYAYELVPKTVFRVLKNSWRPVKVLGRLGKRNGRIVLEVERIIGVQDVEECEKTLEAIGRISRSRYDQHAYDPLTNPELKQYIEQFAVGK